MKWIFAALSLTLAFNVHAADKKIGNVIAVERTIENAHATCINDTQADKSFNPRAQYFGCSFNATTHAADFTPFQSLLRVRANDCTVDADVKDGRVVIMYNGNASNADFNAARTCLRNALNSDGHHDNLTFIVHTVE